MNGNHLKYMLLGAAGLFGVLLAVGVPLQTALVYAAVLSCPLMMLFMMGGGHGTGQGNDKTPNTRDDSGKSSDPTHTHRHGS